MQTWGSFGRELECLREKFPPCPPPSRLNPGWCMRSQQMLKRYDNHECKIAELYNNIMNDSPAFATSVYECSQCSNSFMLNFHWDKSLKQRNGKITTLKTSGYLQYRSSYITWHLFIPIPLYTPTMLLQICYDQSDVLLFNTLKQYFLNYTSQNSA